MSSSNNPYLDPRIKPEFFEMNQDDEGSEEEESSEEELEEQEQKHMRQA